MASRTPLVTGTIAEDCEQGSWTQEGATKEAREIALTSRLGQSLRVEREGGINLEWRNINCYVAEPKEKRCISKFAGEYLGFEGVPGPPTKRIAQGVSGFACSGEVLALMGPSGSGKTTLLNVLAQRPTLGRTGCWTGELLLNGMPPWKDWEREMAYVMQKDIFYDELKVRENLLTTALLRLPYSWSKADKIERLEQVLKDLGLQDVSDTKIGTAMSRGLSGGEVKRTSIANESLLMPKIFLLDEPLTGLDSSRAVDVMQSLRSMARNHGTTVMLTIHQPSSALYECFDKLMLMAPGGRMAYFGDVATATAHFARIGRPVPALWTPTDHYIELLVVENTCSEVCEAWAKADQPVAPAASSRPPCTLSMPPFLYQLRVLWPRSFKRTQRTYLTPMNYKLQVGLALVFGFVYFQVGQRMPERLTDYVGTIFFIVAHWSWTPLFQGLGNFPREKEMLTKEKASRVYDLSAYALGQFLAEAPLLLVLPVVFFAILWPLAGLDVSVIVPNFLVISLNIQVCAGLSMLISAICMDQDMAIPVAIVVMCFQMCCGGYFADMRTLPWWLGWLRFTSFYFYTFGSCSRLLLRVPFSEAVHKEAIQKYSFSDFGYMWEVIALVLQVCFYRMMAYLALKWNKKLTFS